jgi:hypothetical protein
MPASFARNASNSCHAPLESQGASSPGWEKTAEDAFVGVDGSVDPRIRESDVVEHRLERRARGGRGRDGGERVVQPVVEVQNLVEALVVVPERAA